MNYQEWLKIVPKEIIRQLLNVIPAERGYALKEEPIPYYVGNGTQSLENLLEVVPMPELILDETRNTQPN